MLAEIVQPLAGRSAGRWAAACGDLHEVTPVAALHERPGQRLELLPGDVALPVGNLLWAADLEPLPLLDDLHELGGLHQGRVAARVEPGRPPGQYGDLQLPSLQVGLVEVGDLVL